MGSYCDIDSYPTFYSESFHATRKVRKCCECRKTIYVGDVYVNCRMLFDGDFLTYTQCRLCFHLCRAIHLQVGECAIAFCNLRYWASDSGNIGTDVWKTFAPGLNEVFDGEMARRLFDHGDSIEPFEIPEADFEFWQSVTEKSSRWGGSFPERMRI